MTRRDRQVQGLAGDLGELIESRAGGRSLESLAAYRGAPVRFATEVLGARPWSAQVDVMHSVVEHDRVVWYGANGVGKDHAAGLLAIYWAYVQRGLVLLTGPTSRQVHEILMRREIARGQRAGDLPGDLHVGALRLPGHEEASIIAATSSEPGRLQGHHHENGVLAILTESQALAAWCWEAVAGCTASEQGRTLAVGNPVAPSGRLYDVSRPGSGWQVFQTSALEHPNLTGEREIPGGPSASFIKRMREDYGEGSGIFAARVLGRFPSSAAEGLLSADWVDAAIMRGRGVLPPDGVPVVAGIDPARYGPDLTCIAIKRGNVVTRLVTWGQVGLTTTVERAVAILEREGVTPEPDRKQRRLNKYRGPRARRRQRGVVVVDSVGLGAGVADALRTAGFDVREHNAGAAASDTERFANSRAEVCWRLREKLEAGEIALPDDEALREELLALRWGVDGAGRISIPSKDGMRSELGRSPDRLDAVLLCLAPRPKRPAVWSSSAPPRWHHGGHISPVVLR